MMTNLSFFGSRSLSTYSFIKSKKEGSFLSSAYYVEAYRSLFFFLFSEEIQLIGYEVNEYRQHDITLDENIWISKRPNMIITWETWVQKFVIFPRGQNDWFQKIILELDPQHIQN